jgi:hypothetical protein
LEAKLNTFTVLVDKGYHNGWKEPNAQATSPPYCCPSYARKKQRKTQPIFVAQFQYNNRRYLYMSQGEILKPREDGTKKCRTEQSGYQFKKYRTPACKKLSSKPFAPVDQQVEKLTERVCARR